MQDGKPSRRNEFRFAVGTPNGLRSSVWKVWTTGGESYLQSRMMGSSTKVSLHADGSSQWSFTSEWYTKNRPGQKNSDRHIKKWKHPEILQDRAAFVFRVIVPQSELRIIPGTKETLSKVHWVPDPQPGYVQLFECYITPPLGGRQQQPPFPILCSLETTDERRFTVLTHREKVVEKQYTQLAILQEEARLLLEENGMLVKPEFRGVGFTESFQGERGMIEFALVDE